MEHAPPQCLFPEFATFGRDLRKNLITVPSCDQHNSKKSKDDEFLRAALLLASAQQSSAARHQFFRKLLAAVRRRPDTYGAFFQDSAIIDDGVQRVLKLNRARFDSCIDHLVRALYFHMTGFKWWNMIVVASPNFYTRIEAGCVIADEATKRAVEIARAYLVAEPIQGENPEVFGYCLKSDRDANTLAFACQFYGLFEVFAYSTGGLDIVGA